ncbi:MAG: dihydroorotate dehydrogenase (quinone) [Proteobacteria bacterium]|nr:MAG: dihydroorotate dehydrogenase (quinone) [Pseudomonadota bacterium]
MSLLYRSILKPLLFALDAERAHNLISACGAVSCRFPFLISGLRRILDAGTGAQIKICDLVFPNRIGLAAGFDKHARFFPLLGALGFGHVEVGGVVAKAQPGNPLPRLFRLPQDSAIINRMGFPSAGAQAFALQLCRLRDRFPGLIVGVNIGKSKEAPLEEAVQDYLFTFEQIQNYADYVSINVSSPNTPELRRLQEKGRLSELIRAIRQKNTLKRPVFIKIAPDLTLQEIDQVIEVCLAEGVSGIIAVNTSISRDGLSLDINEPGGLSGRPIRAKAREMVEYISNQTAGRLPIIGSGGVSSTEDAAALLDAGASLVQLYTGLIYEGPLLPYKINQGLLRRGIGGASI